MTRFIPTALILMGTFLAISYSNNAAAQKSNTAIKTPITEWIDAENKLIATLPKENQKVFLVLRNKQSVIRSIDMVERDIGNAVASCAKNNPEISSQIKDRFSEWQGAVNPILKDAEKFLDQELKEQEAFYENDFRHITKLNDAAFEFSEGQITKQPVTDLESCQKLIKTMDKTEDTLLGLLQDILLPEEVVRKRLEREEAAKK